VPWLLAACTVGPDFVPPPAPDRTSYDAAALPPAERVAESDQRIDFGRAIPAAWWSLFRCPDLTQTLDAVIASNSTLAAARATVAQAEQTVLAARGGLWPQANLSAGVQRTGSLGAGAPTAGLYSVGPSVTWLFDIFGVTRRTVEQQEALAEAQGYQLAAAHLTLTGEAVSQAVAIAAARRQIATVDEIIASDEKNLDLVRRKFTGGKAARTDVLTAESQLMADRAQISALRQQLSVARHALAVLASRSPAEWSPPDFDLSEFTLPRDLPASVPSDLVHRRPDILTAEAQLHAAGAAVGVATAQLYPSLTLSAALTQQSTAADSLFHGTGNLWTTGAGLAAPVFHGGTLEAQRQAAVEAFNAQLAAYQQTVVQAFGQVADALRALDHDAEFMANARRSLEVADSSLALQRASYAAGKTSVVDLVEAERAFAQARLAFVAAQVQQLQDTVQVFVVMGGGWDNTR
jgi:NodT family efflux transporter outer membrane factor (OMF) lipoprotein